MCGENFAYITQIIILA